MADSPLGGRRAGREEGPMTRIGVTGRKHRASGSRSTTLPYEGRAKPVFFLENARSICRDLANVAGSASPAAPTSIRRATMKSGIRRRIGARARRTEIGCDARDRDVPVLAICRGAQIANVAFGGTLIQDIPALVSGALAHSRDGDKRVFPEHRVAIAPGSRLATIVGAADVATGSRHHQAIGRVATDLLSVATTHDGVVEALEPRFPARFWLAVQWHPIDADDGGRKRALFRCFIRREGRTNNPRRS